MSKVKDKKQTAILLEEKTESADEKESLDTYQPLDGELSQLPQNYGTAPDVSVIIPAYCEEETISEVLRRVIKVSWSLGNVEIIVVDDGSTDKTGEQVTQFPLVKYIRHSTNMGKGAAVKTGVKHARGKIIVIQDADLEYAPEYIPSLVKPIMAGSTDIVYGSRFKGDKDGMSSSHYLGNSLLSLVARLLYNTEISDIMTGQKAFKENVLNSIKLGENGFAVEVEMTFLSLNNGKKYAEVPIAYEYRRHGYSKIGPLDGIKSLLKMFPLFLKS